MLEHLNISVLNLRNYCNWSLSAVDWVPWRVAGKICWFLCRFAKVMCILLTRSLNLNLLVIELRAKLIAICSTINGIPNTVLDVTMLPQEQNPTYRGQYNAFIAPAYWVLLKCHLSVQKSVAIVFYRKITCWVINNSITQWALLNETG